MPLHQVVPQKEVLLVAREGDQSHNDSSQTSLKENDDERASVFHNKVFIDFIFKQVGKID